MKKLFFLLVALFLATASLVACGDGPAATEPPEATQPAPTVEAAATPTIVPTSVPTPDPATEISPGVEISGEGTLSLECSPDDMLNAAAVVISCNAQAMQQVESFSFDEEVNLLALFGAEGAEAAAASMRVSGTVVLPHSLRFEIIMGPEEEMFEISGVTIGADTYVKDPELGQWYKGAPPDSDFLAALQMAGFMSSPSDANAALSGPIDLDDGSRGYVLVSDEPDQGGGAGALGVSGGSVTTIVGVDDFLTREVRVAAMGLDGETRDFVTISYHGYNEALEIEPPSEYVAFPDEVMDSGTPGIAMVVGLAQNSEGDVEVTFNEPVFVEGDVELYVLDPETGGWGLPLLRAYPTTPLARKVIQAQAK